MYQNQVRLFNDFIGLMTMKKRLKMKNRSHWYDINRPLSLDMDTNTANILNTNCVSV